MKRLTTCQLPKPDGTPCGQQFLGDPLVIVEGQEPDKSSRKFIEGLLSHIGKKHPDVSQEINVRWVHFLGFLALRCFSSEDPAVKEQVQNYAAFLRYLVTEKPKTP